MSFRSLAPRHGLGASIAVVGFIQPTIFGDCFGLCAGTIQNGSPGPVCGWMFSEVFGPATGSVTLAPGTMTFNCASITDFPGATKSFSAPLATIFDISAEFRFTEFPTPPQPDTTYSLTINDQDGGLSILLTMFGDGSLFFQFGDPASSPTYLGTWVPNNGPHKVNLSLQSPGTPTLYIDDVSIPLTFFGNLATFGSFFPTNTISFYCGSDDAGASSSVFTQVSVCQGIISPTVRYQCPI